MVGTVELAVGHAHRLLVCVSADQLVGFSFRCDHSEDVGSQSWHGG